jgi:hypothetical protein
MSKIQHIDYVLNPDFKITSTELREDDASMKIDLIRERCLSLIFQLDKKLGANYRGGIYPFFNSRNKNVCKVCDYIIFAESNNTLYSLIIELKKGERDTKPQLKAGECFVDFVIDTVNRIFNMNYTINKRFVSVREFERKRKTKLRDIHYDENYHHFFDQNKLRIYTFLK